MSYPRPSSQFKPKGATYQVPTISSRLAHDLQAPLRRISQFSVILNEDYGQMLDSDGQHFIHVINRSVDELSSLVDGLLACSMAVNEPFVRDSIDLNTLFKEVSEELSDALMTCNAKLDVQTLPVVHGDRNFVFSLFFQLIKNAVMFRRQDVAPEIGIAANSNNRSGDLVISVSDNGRGIPATLKSTLFNALERGDAQGKESGNGLGLYLARVICERHGWSIVVEETAKYLTEFHVHIPANGVVQNLVLSQDMGARAGPYKT